MRTEYGLWDVEAYAWLADDAGEPIRSADRAALEGNAAFTSGRLGRRVEVRPLPGGFGDPAAPPVYGVWLPHADGPGWLRSADGAILWSVGPGPMQAQLAESGWGNPTRGVVRRFNPDGTPGEEA